MACNDHAATPPSYVHLTATPPSCVHLTATPPSCVHLTATPPSRVHLTATPPSRVRLTATPPPYVHLTTSLCSVLCGTQDTSLVCMHSRTAATCHRIFTCSNIVVNHIRCSYGQSLLIIWSHDLAYLFWMPNNIPCCPTHHLHTMLPRPITSHVAPPHHLPTMLPHPITFTPCCLAPSHPHHVAPPHHLPTMLPHLYCMVGWLHVLCPGCNWMTYCCPLM